MRFWIAFLLFCLSTVANATTYYVDFGSGNDSNAGTSTGAAWKTIPGTRNTGNTAFLNSAWGAITTGNKIPAGTTIKLKGGTTHSSANGGLVQIDSSYYDNATAGSPTTIQLDTGWGTGAATIDGTGITVGIALVLVQRDGIIINGVTTDGIDIRNCTISGVQFKEQAGTSAALLDVGIKYVKLFNNSTSATNDSTGSGKFACQFRKATGVTVDHVTVDGDSNWSNGLGFGESDKAVTNCTVTDCTATGLLGDVANNDSGIGFKAFNSQVTFTRCRGYSNLKGFDLGEINGNGRDITYKVISCQADNNTWGINFNNYGGTSYTGTVNFYAVNCLVFTNAFRGILAYAGPFNIYIVHCTLYNNGTDGTSFARGNIMITPDASVTPKDGSSIRSYLRNNIGYKPNGANANSYNLGVSFWAATGANSGGVLTDHTMDSDYNSWTQSASDVFAYWGYSAGSDNNATFSYGTNGPGKASGNYYAYYGGTATAPSNGSTGHFHNDANSKGTGATDTTAPPFTNYGTGDVTLTAHYAGENLSGKSWYISEMGVDRNGVTRANWDMGPYEYVTGDVTAPLVSGASINSAGTTLSLTFSESVTGVVAADYAITGGGTLSAASGSGTAWTMTISPAVLQGDTRTLSYTGTATVDGASNRLATFSAASITNNSTVAGSSSNRAKIRAKTSSVLR